MAGSLEKLVDVQKKIAAETGCAFFNTFHAMGGAGTMARWYNAKPRLVSADLIHPYPAAGRQIAERLATIAAAVPTNGTATALPASSKRPHSSPRPA